MKLSKSKLALAKVINENGGWADDSVYAANDEGGIICGYSSKPNRHITTSYAWSGRRRNTWIRGIKTPQWHQCVLSREEYYQAYPKADADGFIEWNGGECPVDFDDDVDVTLRLSIGAVQCKAGDVRWSHLDIDSDIIAYRLHKPDVKPELCESVIRSIPDPELRPTIEQLAQDYRNAKGHADGLQKEAGEAAVKAEEFAVEIRKKILELQELIGISKPEPEPELVITDWRDLRVNDVIFVGEYDGHESGEHVVVKLEDSDYDYDYAVMTTGIDGAERWIDTTAEWRFIRRS